MEIILEIQNLNKSFGNNKVLDNINLAIGKGELVSIIGRSGCGKTTLLRCINCLEVFDSGIIRVNGIEIALNNGKSNFPTESQINERKKVPDWFYEKAHQIRLQVGLLFQNLNLFSHLTVLENIITAPMIVRKESKKIAIEKAKKLLEKVGLIGFEDRYPYQLSGGQSQRVAIARALAMNPQIMLYDEPTSALDPELVGEVLNVMKTLHNEGMTQIVVTHAINFARTASDYVVFMENGRIIEYGTPDQIFLNPKDPRTDAYVKLFKENGV
ncbi:MAG: amino acid ABC transporter ATP-binding protein [Candidatus Kapaibacteriales bacterium]